MLGGRTLSPRSLADWGPHPELLVHAASPPDSHGRVRVGSWFSQHAFPHAHVSAMTAPTSPLSTRQGLPWSPNVGIQTDPRSSGPDQPGSALLWASQDNSSLEAPGSSTLPKRQRLRLLNQEEMVPPDLAYLWTLRNQTDAETEKQANKKIRPLNTENKPMVARGGG